MSTVNTVSVKLTVESPSRAEVLTNTLKAKSKSIKAKVAAEQKAEGDMDDKVLKTKFGNGRIRRRAKQAVTNRKTAKLANGAIYYFRKLASRISPSAGICPPITPEVNDSIMIIGCFARKNKEALLSLEAKFSADSTPATTKAEKMLLSVGVKPE
jgi:hypothetical protein